MLTSISSGAGAAAPAAAGGAAAPAGAAAEEKKPEKEEGAFSLLLRIEHWDFMYADYGVWFLQSPRSQTRTWVSVFSTRLSPLRFLLFLFVLLLRY